VHTTEGLVVRETNETKQKGSLGDGQTATNLGVILDGLVEAMVVGVHDLVDDVLDEVALLFEELDLALAVLGGEDVHDVRQRVEPRGRPALVDPRQAFLEVLRPRAETTRISISRRSQFRASVASDARNERRWGTYRFVGRDGEAIEDAAARPAAAHRAGGHRRKRRSGRGVASQEIRPAVGNG
jgi:hypothetical protein